MAEELKAAFFIYVEPVAEVLVPLIGFGYLDDVRIASMAAMPELLGSSVGALKAGTVGATPENVALLKNAILGPIIEQLKIEPDIETLAQVTFCLFTQLLSLCSRMLDCLRAADVHHPAP